MIERISSTAFTIDSHEYTALASMALQEAYERLYFGKSYAQRTLVFMQTAGSEGSRVCRQHGLSRVCVLAGMCADHAGNLARGSLQQRGNAPCRGLD